LTFLALPFVLGWSLTLQTGTPAVPAGDQWLTKPVDDRTFNTYQEFFTYDRQLPLDLKVAKVEDDQGVRRERLSFQSTPGVRVTGILFQGAAAAGTKPPGLILLHGGSQKGKDGAGMIQLGALLSRAGWTVLSLDMGYFGERSTELLTTFSDKEKHDKLYNQPSVYLGWVTQTVKDVRRGIDLLVEQRGVDARRTGIVGASRGAILATIASGVDRRLSPVLLQFAGHFDAGENNHLPAACPANYIARIAPRPVLMINGTEDSDMIKDRAVEPLFKLARQPKQIIWTDGGHMFMNEEHRATMIQWLREQHK
jgi:dipeptidyl aminopeptidase/acylaminoacyl peptidase